MSDPCIGKTTKWAVVRSWVRVACSAVIVSSLVWLLDSSGAVAALAGLLAAGAGYAGGLIDKEEPLL